MSDLAEAMRLFEAAAAGDAAVGELGATVDRLRWLNEVLATAYAARRRLAEMDPDLVEQALLLRGSRAERP